MILMSKNGTYQHFRVKKGEVKSGLGVAEDEADAAIPLLPADLSHSCG